MDPHKVAPLETPRPDITEEGIWEMAGPRGFQGNLKIKLSTFDY